MKINTQIKLIISLFCLFSCFELSAKPGDLDSSFGINGVIVEYLKDYPEIQIRGLAVQSDMKIIAACCSRYDSNSNYTILLKRYNYDGTVDQTYGFKGISKYEILSKNDSLNSFAIDGYDNSLVLIDSNTVLKFDINGNLDSSFAENGKIVLEGWSLNCLKTDKKGRILLVGSIAKDADSGMGLMRLKQNGTIDSSFNKKGFVAIDFENNFGRAYDLIIDNIYYTLCGTAYYEGRRDFALARTYLHGRIDSSFGVNGRVMLKFKYNSILEYILRSDTLIYVAGWASDYAAPKERIYLLRLNFNGWLDQSFGDNGISDFYHQHNDYAKGMHLQSDGKILISGESLYWEYLSIFLARCNPDGTKDTNFAEDGVIKAIVSYGGYSSIINDDYAILAGTTFDEFRIFKYKLFLEVGIIESQTINSTLVYPNPVRSRATINYELLQDDNVTIEIYDSIGKKIKTLATDSPRFAGSYTETIDFSDISEQATYFIRIKCSRGTVSIKCIKE